MEKYLDAFIAIGFIIIFCTSLGITIYFTLKKIDNESDPIKIEKLRRSIYLMLFFAIFISVSLGIGYFLGTFAQ
jgi:hypothetical protein